MEERRLLEQLKKRQRGALERAIDRYTPYVSTVVWRTLGPAATREDAEEVVSDVFLALWAGADSVTGEHLRAWLAAVARNKAADRLRRAEQAAAPLLDSDADPAMGPEEQAETREWAARLWQAVQSLEEPDRTLFVRYYYEGEKLKDVAKELNLQPATARTRLHRGRKVLKQRLTEGGEQPCGET